MERFYRRHARVAAFAFFLVAAYTLLAKLQHGRPADDWFHGALHLGSGPIGAGCGWYARAVAPGRAFTWGVGLLYSALGTYGWFTNGLLLGTPLAIPLGAAENVFHLVLGVLALTILRTGARRER